MKENGNMPNLHKLQPPHFAGIDYIKVVACFSVLLVHFRLNVQYTIPANTFGRFVALFMATDYELFITSVPLFFMCTGYLMLNKKFSYDYYIKLGKVLLLYLMCSLLTYVILVAIKHQTLAVHQIWDGIRTYQLIGYAWYVKIYATLYLLIPFINLLIARFNEANKYWLLALIGVLMLAVGLPTPLSTGFGINFPINYHVIYQLYPYVYYLIGAYLRKFPIKINWQWLLSVEILTTVAGIGINMLRRAPFVGGEEGNYPSLLVMVQSLALFMLINALANRPTKWVSWLSKYTLPIYLMSFVVDMYIYPFFIHLLGSGKATIPYALVIGIVVFGLSLALTLIAEAVTNFIWPYLYRVLGMPQMLWRKPVKVSQ